MGSWCVTMTPPRLESLPRSMLGEPWSLPALSRANNYICVGMPHRRFWMSVLDNMSSYVLQSAHRRIMCRQRVPKLLQDLAIALEHLSPTLGQAEVSPRCPEPSHPLALLFPRAHHQIPENMAKSSLNLKWIKLNLPQVFRFDWLMAQGLYSYSRGYLS